MYKIWNDDFNRATPDFEEFQRMEIVARAKKESYCVKYLDGRFYECKFKENN